MKNLTGVDLSDLKATRAEMERYCNHLKSQGDVWREAFEMQEAQARIKELKQMINDVFSHVESNSDVKLASATRRERQEFNSLVHQSTVNLKLMY